MCSPLVMQHVKQQLSRRNLFGMAGAAAASAAAMRLMPAAAQDAATPMAAASGPGTLAFALGAYTQVADLTHLLGPETPVWPGNPQVAIAPFRTYAENGFYANEITLVEHVGTHMDAPAHFFEGAQFANQLAVEQLIAPLVVIDISAKAASDPDAQVTPDDITAWESANGEIPTGAFIAMNSGWADKISDPEAFINMDDSDVMHFPGFHPDATNWLIEQRDIRGVGVDTLSLDFGASTDFATHVAVLGSGRYGLEGLAGLSMVPAVGGAIVVGGPKIDVNSGGPSRVLALF